MACAQWVVAIVSAARRGAPASRIHFAQLYSRVAHHNINNTEHLALAASIFVRNASLFHGADRVVLSWRIVVTCCKWRDVAIFPVSGVRRGCVDIMDVMSASVINGVATWHTAHSGSIASRSDQRAQLTNCAARCAVALVAYGVNGMTSVGGIIGSWRYGENNERRAGG